MWTEEERQEENKLDREASELVSREVFVNCSYLVQELAKNQDLQEDIWAISSQEQFIHTFSFTCQKCSHNWEEEDEPRTDNWYRLRDVDDVDEFIRPCPNCGEKTEPEDVNQQETDAIEALEHWIVSRWFAEKLQQQGEMVGEICGLWIWGRRTSGQAISMDYVVRQIAKSIRA